MAPMSLLGEVQTSAIRVLRWSERYTKTDMVYLATVGIWTNLNFIIVSGLTLLVSIAFANLLPRETYGNYQYLLSLSALVAAITLGGMNTAVAQSVARGFEGDLRAAVRIQLAWNVVPTGIGLAGALYYALADNMSLAAGIAAIAVFTPLWSAWNTYAAFLQGKREFRRIFTYGTSINLVYYASIFLCILLYKNAALLVGVNLASNALATGFFYARTLKTFRPNDRIDPHTIRYGTHLSLMNALGTVVTQLDSVLVFHFLGAAQLAVYSFASMLPERVGGLFKFVTVAALPKFSHRTRSEIQATIVSKTLRSAIAGALVALTYAALAPTFFRLLFPSYLDAIPFTELYALSIVTTAANIPTTALYALRMHRELYAFNVINPIVLLALQVPLLLFFGIPGILIARVLSNAINIALSILFLFFPLSNDFPYVRPEISDQE
jgi:O-antigen/teichoic acid export membrane protein